MKKHKKQGENTAMAQIISVLSRKGGTGKTTTTQALGNGLTKKGYKVLFIDLDSQGNLSYSVGAKATNKTMYEVIVGGLNIKEAIQHTEQGDVVPSSERLAITDKALGNPGDEYRLKEQLDQIKKEYDYILIDTSAQLGILTANTLTATNKVVIPVQADIYSLQGIALLNSSIEPIKKYYNKKLKIEGILITRFNPRSNLSKDMRDNLENIAKELKTKVFNTSIRECTAIKESSMLKQPIYDYAPKCNASIDYMNFVNEIIGE